VVPLLPRIEPEDTALIVGTEAAPTTYLLAAHDAAVTFIAGDLGCVERVESRMAAEALASMFESYVTQLDQALPDFLSFLTGVDVVVLDPNVLADLCAADRAELVGDLQSRSRPGGIHVLLPTCKAIGPDALRSLYPGWIQEEDPKRRRRSAESRRQDGLILSKPMCPPDTA
jgi:hypothetical protein